jgi:hypothetical protein
MPDAIQGPSVTATHASSSAAPTGQLGAHSVELGVPDRPRAEKSTVWMEIKHFFASLFSGSARLDRPASPATVGEKISCVLSSLSQWSINPETVLRDMHRVQPDFAVRSQGLSLDEAERLRQGLIRTEIASGSDLQLWRMFKNLNSPEGRQLMALTQEAVPVVMQHDVNPGDPRFVELGALVGTTTMAVQVFGEVVKELESRGYATGVAFDPQGLYFQVDLPAADTAGAGVRALGRLADEIVAPYRSIPEQPVSELTRSTMESRLPPMKDEGSRQRPHAEHPRGCEVFIRDLERPNKNTFQIREGSGAPVPLLNREGFSGLEPDQRATRIEEGLDRLLEFCGGDKNLLFRMTQYANQGVPLVLNTMVDPPEANPFELDGRKVAMPHLDAAVYSFAKESENIVLRVEVRSPLPFVMETDRNGATVMLDPERSHLAASFELVFTPDRETPTLRNTTIEALMKKLP